MELKMGCFVMTQSILLQGCLLFSVPSNSKFLLFQVHKEKVVYLFWAKHPHNTNTAEEFWLVSRLYRCESLNPVHSVGSVLVPVWAALLSSSMQACILAQRTSVETEGENRFHFPLLKLIHPFFCWKSGEMHFHHELFLFQALCREPLPN